MPRFTHPVHLVLGFIIWSFWFVAVYGGLSVACAVAPPGDALGAATAINVWLLLLTFLTTALLLYLAFRCWRAAAPGMQGLLRFLPQVAAGAYLAAAIATFAVGLPAMVLPPCV